MRLGLIVFWSFLLGGCERPLPVPADQAVRPAKLFQVTASQAGVIVQ